MQQSKRDVRFALLFFSVIALVFSSPSLGSSNKAIAAGTFTIEAKINLQNLSDVGKLKVVTSANGDTQVKNVTGNDLKSKSTTVSF